MGGRRGTGSRKNRSQSKRRQRDIEMEQDRPIGPETRTDVRGWMMAFGGIPPWLAAENPGLPALHTPELPARSRNQGVRRGLVRPEPCALCSVAVAGKVG